MRYIVIFETWIERLWTADVYLGYMSCGLLIFILETSIVKLWTADVYLGDMSCEVVDC
jgi:hypothetical protein